MASTKVPRTTHTWLQPLYAWLESFVLPLITGGGALRADAAIVANLTSYVYANGTAGVGATLTAGSNAAFGTKDGVAAALNKVYLVAGQTSGQENGLYKLTQVGDGSHPAILTRVTTFDESAEIKDGTIIEVKGGTVYADKDFKYTGGDSPTVGTTALTFALDPTINGTDVAKVADVNVAGGVPVVYRTLIASGANANVDIAVNDKVRIIDAWAVLKGAGTAGGLLTLKNGTSAVSDAIDVSAGGDRDVFRCGEIDDAQHEVAAGGTLRWTKASTGGDFPGAEAYVLAVRVA